MYKDAIIGHRMTDAESKLFVMCEIDSVFQRAVDYLNEDMNFTLTEKEIRQIFEDGKCIKYDSVM